jgi:hypothetical protein
MVPLSAIARWNRSLAKGDVMNPHVDNASRFTKDRHIGGIGTGCCNAFLNPPEGRNLIQNCVIARRMVGRSFRELRMSEETKRPEPIVGADYRHSVPSETSPSQRLTAPS